MTPRYVPHCNYGACRDKNAGTSSTATQYVVIGTTTWHVCGACAHKLAIAAGLERDPKAEKVKTKRKPRPVS